MAAAVVTLSPPENSSLSMPARAAFSFLLVFWLPGYCFTRVLFPGSRLNRAERALLSIGVSIVLVPVVGLLLDEAQVGLTPTWLVSSLIAVSLLCAFVALLRQTFNEAHPDP
ncbi:MAG: DUF1616 domain-containing protein [Candidatus Bathyarchaeia archaeon]